MCLVTGIFHVVLQVCVIARVSSLGWLMCLIGVYRDDIKGVFTSLPDVFPKSPESTALLAVIMMVLSLVLDMHATLSYALETRPKMFSDGVKYFGELHAGMCNQFQKCWSWLLDLRDKLLRRPKYVFKLQATLSDPLLSSAEMTSEMAGASASVHVEEQEWPHLADEWPAATRDAGLPFTPRFGLREWVASGAVVVLVAWLCSALTGQVEMDVGIQKACDFFNSESISLGGRQDDTRWCRVGLQPCLWSGMQGCGGCEGGHGHPSALRNAIREGHFIEPFDGFQAAFVIAAAHNWSMCSFDLLNRTHGQVTTAQVSALEEVLVNGGSCRGGFSLLGVPIGSTSLELTRKDQTDPETFAKVLRTELKHNALLSSLTLKKAGNASARVVGQYVSRLISLNLSSCEVDGHGAGAIMEGLGDGKKTLKSLDLSYNFLGDQGGKVLHLDRYGESA